MKTISSRQYLCKYLILDGEISWKIKKRKSNDVSIYESGKLNFSIVVGVDMILRRDFFLSFICLKDQPLVFPENCKKQKL